MMDFTHAQDKAISTKQDLIRNELEEKPRRLNQESDSEQGMSLGRRKHFELFSEELESNLPNTNPTMNIINFYKILFNDVPDLNLDMAEVLKMYKAETEKLKPSEK